MGAYLFLYYVSSEYQCSFFFVFFCVLFINVEMYVSFKFCPLILFVFVHYFHFYLFQLFLFFVANIYLLDYKWLLFSFVFFFFFFFFFFKKKKKKKKKKS